MGHNAHDAGSEVGVEGGGAVVPENYSKSAAVLWISQPVISELHESD